MDIVSGEATLNGYIFSGSFHFCFSSPMSSFLKENKSFFQKQIISCYKKYGNQVVCRKSHCLFSFEIDGWLEIYGLQSILVIPRG